MVKTPTSPSNIAVTVLQTAAASRYPKEQAMAELGTYADLAEQEAPGNPYSALLSSVLAVLEQGGTLEQALKVARSL